MFAAALIVLSLWNGVLGSETACRVLAERSCNMNSIPPVDLPGTYDRLMAECQNLYKVKQCIIDYVNKCMEEKSVEITIDEHDLERLKDNKRMLELTTEICQDNSPLHTKYVQDMSCFREVLNSESGDTCSDYYQKVLSHLKSRIDPKVKNQEKDKLGRQPIYYCLNVLTEYNCWLSMFNNKCGTRAKDTALEIIGRVASLYSICPDSIRVDMVELIDAWKSVSKQEVYIRDLILSDI